MAVLSREGSDLGSLMPVKGQESEQRDCIDHGTDISPIGDSLPHQQE
jgi:hypothetical protein